MTEPHRSIPGRAAALPVIALWLLLAATACGGSPTATVPRCGNVRDIAPGDAVDGTLGTGDDRFDGAFIDYYDLELDEPRGLEITQSSSDLDPLLLLFDADGEIIAQAFQEEGSPPGTLETATLTRSLESGCYLLGATAWDRGGTGVYTLTVESDDT